MNKSKTQGNAKEDRALRPAQKQNEQPGREFRMTPQPRSMNPEIEGSNKLLDKVVLISGGDSGIGRACSLSFAREGADVAIIYLEEDKDAWKTSQMVQDLGRRCLLIEGDIRNEEFCKQAVDITVKKFGHLDILINNTAEQHPQKDILDIDEEQLRKTFETNIFSMFFLVKAAVPYLKKVKGSSIINTTSVTAYRGSPELLDYSATKGAIVAFTRSLSQSLIKQGIRVNAVAPGPIWTPLIPSTFPADEVETFGADTPIGRAGEPWECAECFVFLASRDSSYMTGQILHPNGGEIING
jgi:NAD(P)-dependent dehydrogenase (short-subunit alcohol dehydrogenase family)